MITLIALGLGALVVLAVVVGLVDRAGAVTRRMTAAERRDDWERRHRGVAVPGVGARER